MIWLQIPDKIRKEKQREKRSDGELVTRLLFVGWKLRLFTIFVIGAVALNGKRKAQIRSACSLLGAWKRVCKAHLEVIDNRCHTNQEVQRLKGFRIEVLDVEQSLCVLHALKVINSVSTWSCHVGKEKKSWSVIVHMLWILISVHQY